MGRQSEFVVNGQHIFQKGAKEMNAMKRFALLGTVLMSFLTGCGTQQENTANSQTIPKAAVSSDTVKEIAQTGMSTTVPDIYCSRSNRQEQSRRSLMTARTLSVTRAILLRPHKSIFPTATMKTTPKHATTSAT